MSLPVLCPSLIHFSLPRGLLDSTLQSAQLFSTISQTVHSRWKRRLDVVVKQLSAVQEENLDLTVANQNQQTSNADLT